MSCVVLLYCFYYSGDRSNLPLIDGFNFFQIQVPFVVVIYHPKDILAALGNLQR